MCFDTARLFANFKFIDDLTTIIHCGEIKHNFKELTILLKDDLSKYEESFLDLLIKVKTLQIQN